MSEHTGTHPAQVQLAENWNQPYTGEDTTGKHVIALWSFDAGAEARDVSGNGHDLVLHGAHFGPEGRFGGALESFRGWPEEDRPHQARAENDPALSPPGAFTIEMWVRPKPELEGYPEAFLLDKKYVAHTDYQLILSAADKTGCRHLNANLGFGADSETFSSDPAAYEPGVWHHLAFTYDGAGTGRFYCNGATLGHHTRPGRGPVAPGSHALTIGDRIGSYYHGFPGCIDQVRLCHGGLEFRPTAFTLASDRTVFVRMEEAEPLLFTLTNLQRNPAAGARVLFSLQGWQELEIAIPELASGHSYTLELALDTRLRPGPYRLTARIEIPGETPCASEEQFSLTLVPRPLPHRMPVVMWGAGPGEVERLKDLGFTHCAGVAVDNALIWNAGESTRAGTATAVAQTRKDLDRALAEDLGLYAYVAPGRWARRQEEYRRVDRDGKNSTDDICGLYPRLREFCYHVGASVVQTYGSFPAFNAALIHTEVRGESEVCFHEHDQDAFRQFAGFEIPGEALDKYGTPYQDLQDFPADRIIPDDYPLYVYYQWLWKQGDGWNDLHTAVHEGLKSAGRRDLWTWYDPAVRAASIWGSGGEVDVLSQWTYSYPDPIRIGMATDELFAMVPGRPGQQVMKMTQIIWYRSRTAPEADEAVTAQTGDFQDQDEKVAGAGASEGLSGYQARWEQEQPGARFITIAPMHLRVAFWAKLSRPIQGIMYHGWQSLVETDGTNAYCYTHPETRHELRRLIKTVLEPLGAALMQVPDRPGDVAFLESFASQMFARRGTYGWNGSWAGDAYLILLYAQLQPEIIYDETIVEKGLEGFKVLVLANCDVLAETVAQKVQAFQDRGGILIGDDRLCPALEPDILVQRFERPERADAARRQLQGAATELRQELDRCYQRYAFSTNPDVITRLRRYGSADYLFAVNDRREYGDYVGHHGLVMENGLPSDASLVVQRQQGFAYDLVRGRQVESAFAGDHLEIDAHFGPGEGRVYLIADRALAGVQVEVLETARLGAAVEVGVAVVDEEGRPIDAVIPVKVEFFDPDGRAAEFSGYYGARDGQLRIRLDLAANEVPGLWRISVEELASGRTAAAYLRVTQAGTEQD